MHLFIYAFIFSFSYLVQFFFILIFLFYSFTNSFFFLNLITQSTALVNSYFKVLVLVIFKATAGRTARHLKHISLVLTD